MGLGSGQLNYSGLAANCNSGGCECLITSEGGENFLYFEGVMNADAADFGILFRTSNFYKIRNTRIDSASYNNVYIDASHSGRIEGLHVEDGGAEGIKIEMSSYNVIQGLFAMNNIGRGVYLAYDTGVNSFPSEASANNSLSQVVAVGNGSHGIHVHNGFRNTLSHITARLNGGQGVFVESSTRDGNREHTYNAVVNMLSHQNTGHGIRLEGSGSYDNGFKYNIFAGGNTSIQCQIYGAGTNNDLVNDTGSTCQAQAGYFNLMPVVDNAFASSIGSFDSNEYKLFANDMSVLDRSYDGSGNQAFAVDDACPQAVDGNMMLEDQQSTANSFLVNATEIINDGSGDDDGLCESNESCIYSPNFGAYQGHGDLSSGTCDFSNGNIFNVKMYRYSSNGI